MSAPLELREASNGFVNLSGYASTFDVEYPIGGGQTETVRRGAFKRTLAELDQNKAETILRVEHRGIPLASTRGKAGGAPTLRLSEDSTGLRMDADLNPKDPRVTELRAASEHVPLQASFAFNITSQNWDREYLAREILGANLNGGDVAIVGYGANPQTSADVRAAGLTFEERRAAAEYIGKRAWGPAFGSDVRSGYAAHELGELGSEGKAFKRPDGGWSFPTKTQADLEDAIKMVGLSGSSYNAVRRYLRKRAIAMGLTRLIPANWASDGSARAALVDLEQASQELDLLGAQAGASRWGGTSARAVANARARRQEAQLAVLARR